MGLPKSAKLRGKRFKFKYYAHMQDCGLCDDSKKPRRIWIKTTQKPKDLLESIVHEAEHAVHPDLSEETVTESAEAIANLLWKFGYRLTKDL